MIAQLRKSWTDVRNKFIHFMSIQTVFFDTSDTLYHNEKLKQAHSDQPIHQLTERNKISFDKAKLLFNKTEKKLRNSLDHVTKASVMKEIGVPRLEMQEYIAQIDPSNFLEPDLKLNEILISLNERYKLGIISNILKKTALRVLNALQIREDIFTYFVTVDNTVRSKPNPEPFLKAIELAECSPENCVYVADSLTKDIIPAKKVGMKTVWITNQEMKSEYADQTIGNIYEVGKALNMLY